MPTSHEDSQNVSTSDPTDNPTLKPMTKTRQSAQVSRDALDVFFDAYFNVIQRHLPLVDRERFLSSTIKADNHQAKR